MGYNNSEYQIKLEISGATAMWTRPDTGDHPVSYPAPTYSAIKGMLESILWWQSVDVHPVKVEICKPIQFHNYWNNYRGPLRKSDLRKSGNSQQLKFNVLTDVCYRIYADVFESQQLHRINQNARNALKGTTSSCHAYHDVFHRRLKNGRWHRVPCLGLKEFVPDYIGQFRDETKICTDINLKIPSMTFKVFESGLGGMYSPKMKTNAEIIKGVLRYAE